MSTEASLYREMLVSMKYPDALIPIECAWISQQPAGTARHMLTCMNIIKEFLDAKRRKE
jgi:hypothetical protein